MFNPHFNTVSAEHEIIRTARDIYDHELAVSYEEYRQARYEARRRCHTAVLELGDVLRLPPSYYQDAFRLQALVLHMKEDLDGPGLAEATFNSYCSVLRGHLHHFAISAGHRLSTIRRPFCSEALRRCDTIIRDLFYAVNGISCHRKTLIFAQPRVPEAPLGPSLNIQIAEYEQARSRLVQRFHYGSHLNFDTSNHEQTSSTPKPSVPSTNLTCGVCWDQVAADKFIQGKLMRECEHEANVCRSCLAQSITSQLDSKPWNQLTCPLCTVRIDGSVVEKFAPSNTISR